MNRPDGTGIRVARDVLGNVVLVAAPGLLLALAGAIWAAANESLANDYLASGYRALAIAAFGLELDRNALAAFCGAVIAGALVSLLQARRFRAAPLLVAAVSGVIVLVATSVLLSEGWRVADYHQSVGGPLPRALSRRLLATVGGLIGLVSFFGLWMARPKSTVGKGRQRSPGPLRRLASMAVVSIGVGWVALRALGPIVAEPVSNPYPVIYIAWDSVRADFVSGYGHAHDTTPNLDEFARRAVLFEHTVSPSSWTRPAFTGIMTSVPFWKIGALGSPAGRRYLTLAELLKNRGYRTIGFAQNPNLDARLGFGQGFDEYVHVYRSQEPELMNRLVLPRVEELLSSDRPFFLFVHYQEPHWPYRGDALPNVEAGTFALDDEEVGALMRRDAGWDPEAPNAAEQLDFLHRAYDGDIRAADEALGELLDALRRSELWSQSLIVINSDHGDEFQEHGDFGHAHANLFPEITLVPQVIKFPDALGITPGRVAEFVEAQDIVPTILDVLGIEAPRQIEGRSLVPHDRLDDEPWVARSAFGNLLMLRSGDGAVLLDAGNDAEQQYFDRSVDPQELNPAAWTPDDPSMARISELVAPYAEEWFLRRGAGDDAEVVLDPELQRRLRALGYIR